MLVCKTLIRYAPFMEKQWELLNPDPKVVKTLSRQLGCTPLVARLMALRGIQSETEAGRFLNPKFANLTPPLRMAGMNRATRRIHRALVDHEKILVFGDYDADGITATALLTTFLKTCGAQIGYYIPHRISDGYGMGTAFIRKRAVPAGVGLIITADCGTGNGKAVTLARQHGIDTIVTDHHPSAASPADAIAVINPALSGCQAKLAHLAGVGVAFYTIIALRSYLREKGFWVNREEPNLKDLCDLVAVGTVADVAPLVGENRVLTGAGLQCMSTAPRPGIAALMDLAGISGRPVDTETIAFRLAPRLNAAGRIVHARMACELLMTANRQKAFRLASALCRLNIRRQSMESQLLDLIHEQLAASPHMLKRPVLVLDGHRWHEGILGIVASRLARQFNRPAVVIGTKNGVGRGSGRSVQGIDLAAALAHCSDLLDRFGGHPLAAGLSLPTGNIEPFRQQLEAVVVNMQADSGLESTLTIDAHVPLDRVTPNLLDDVARLGPFGQGNPYPLFMDTKIRVCASRIVGEHHRQMTLEGESGKNKRHKAILFNASGRPMTADRFDKIAYRPQWNYWNGKRQLQLIVEAAISGG